MSEDTTDEAKLGNRCPIRPRACGILCLILMFMLVFYCAFDVGVSRARISSRDNRSMTIISAYFNLGTFRKGALARSSPTLYRKWASSLTRMRNPLVFYTDDLSFKSFIEHVRRNLSVGTTVIFISNRTREGMWAFGLREKIESIFKDPKYPKHYPSTVNPDYACVQNAKYELVMGALDRKLHVADYYAWLDVGYFRQISKSSFEFRLEVPSDFNQDRVAYTQIQPMKPNLSINQVIRGNKLWLGGGMFIGVENRLRTLVTDYKKAVNVFLSRGLMNTDQQIIYAMFTEDGNKLINPSVQPQAYVPPRGHNPWFYLGFLCLKEEDAVT